MLFVKYKKCLAGGSANGLLNDGTVEILNDGTVELLNNGLLDY